MNNNIYKMSLHEMIWEENCGAWILRVPGGWIYKFYDNAVFVRYNVEFHHQEE